jgi:hypothetical protein
MMFVFMEAAQAAGVADRVISYHSSVGVLEWPPVVFSGIRYPGVSELAALQSAAFGVPADRHLEVTRTMPGLDGTIPRAVRRGRRTSGPRRKRRWRGPICRATPGTFTGAHPTRNTGGGTFVSLQLPVCRASAADS